MKQTDYTGKCGTCAHFERDGEKKSGWCHAKRYDTEEVVCDLEHPYPTYPMSKAKCMYYKEEPV